MLDFKLINLGHINFVVRLLNNIVKNNQNI